MRHFQKKHDEGDTREQTADGVNLFVKKSVAQLRSPLKSSGEATCPLASGAKRSRPTVHVAGLGGMCPDSTSSANGTVRVRLR